VIFWEGSAADPALKPPELHQLVENFCLGTRRLELFGRAASVRPGWVTALAPGQDAPAALAAARVRVRAEDEGEDRTMDVAVDADGRETLVARVRKEEGAPLLAVRWDRAAWEAEVAELANGGKAVVAMSAGACCWCWRGVGAERAWQTSTCCARRAPCGRSAMARRPAEAVLRTWGWACSRAWAWA
jgi:hypothetical protein